MSNEQSASSRLTDDMITDAAILSRDTLYNAAVGRFLCWKLPVDFAPDAGISFAPHAYQTHDNPSWPTGTNLLNAQQARAMFEHCLQGGFSAALCKAVDAMRAFTDPEGNMPADTGEFRDLKAALIDAESEMADAMLAARAPAGDWLTRLKAERDELGDRLGKLRGFLATNREVQGQKRDLLVRQERAMSDYLGILVERILDAEDEA